MSWGGGGGGGYKKTLKVTRAVVMGEGGRQGGDHLTPGPEPKLICYNRYCTKQTCKRVESGNIQWASSPLAQLCIVT